MHQGIALLYHHRRKAKCKVGENFLVCEYVIGIKKGARITANPLSNYSFNQN